MRILADENIPFIERAFQGIGQVTTLPGHAVTREVVQQCDILLVRSVTRIDRSLLEGSPVRFVGSATIGTDHVDLEALRHLGVRFAHAPGSNALSVVEYVLTALLHHCVRTGVEPDALTVGVVGCGNTGGRLAGRLRALGCRVLHNDPPLARQAEAEGQSHAYVSLDELLDESDGISLHVPLIREGVDRTVHLLDATRLNRLKPSTLLVNTSRGAVVDNRALLDALRGRQIGSAVLDVWEGEPAPDPHLLERVSLGTPHIAGYSYDGKVEGTRMLVEAVAAMLGIDPPWDGRAERAQGADDHLDLDPIPFGGSTARWLYGLASQAYPIEHDDRRMRAYLTVDPKQRGSYFASLRRDYPRRRTFGLFRLVASACPAPLALLAGEGLGFQVV